MKLLLTLTLVALFAYLVGGAVDYEQGQAGMLPERGKGSAVLGGIDTWGPDPSLMPRSESIQPLHNSAGGTGKVEVGVSSPESVRGDATPAGPLIEGKSIGWWHARAVRNRREANQQRRNSLARGQTIRRLRRELAAREVGPTLAIRLVFGAYAEQALRVAWCESRWDTGATNGQYLGLFQMGSYARSRYGHSGDAVGQARAAYRYFVESGRDWSPWACKP